MDVGNGLGKRSTQARVQGNEWCHAESVVILVRQRNSSRLTRAAKSNEKYVTQPLAVWPRQARAAALHHAEKTSKHPPGHREALRPIGNGYCLCHSATQAAMRLLHHRSGLLTRGAGGYQHTHIPTAAAKSKAHAPEQHFLGTVGTVPWPAQAHATKS